MCFHCISSPPSEDEVSLDRFLEDTETDRDRVLLLLECALPVRDFERPRERTRFRDVDRRRYRRLLVARRP